MVKLVLARESRIYGPQLARNRFKYMNAGLYCGFAAQLSSEPKSGLVLLLIGLAFIIFVNVHDLLAHLTGINYRLPLMEFNVQLGLVEFAVPVVQITATLLYFLGILFIFIQAIDTIISLYENSFPMRFGVILYSTKFIKKIESNSEELLLDPVENDSGTEEDVSR
ncbi:uncharacterized protein LOC132295109 isoform X2 [Cornus florida]|uniref:uncharacterized protein LOC132295109 isoform X2 n=1 Tax=Cornus florida TaxID=4283 RepID=UPI00289A5A21|nr:uncharacterized protein LOC132295109 isoform X2 [Cornus florida]